MGTSQNLSSLLNKIELARWDYLTGSRGKKAAAFEVMQLSVRKYELCNLQDNIGAVFGYNTPKKDDGDGFDAAEKRLMYRHIQHKPSSRLSVIRSLYNSAATMEAWEKAYEANDFDIAAKPLARSMNHAYKETKRTEKSAFWSDVSDEREDLRDVALDSKSEGLRHDHIYQWGKTLEPFCRDMLEKEGKRQATQRHLHACAFNMPAETQEKLLRSFLEKLGYDESRGKLAPSPHPICLGRNDDVRIGYTIDEDNFLNTLLAMAHEGGHAFYRQNLPAEHKNDLCGGVAGDVMDEAMALLFENEIFRTKAGAEFIYDMVAREVGEPYKSRLSAQMILKQLTKLEPHGLRAKSDDIRYPLDIIHRHDMLFDLYNRSRKWTTEYRDVWNALSEYYLNTTPADDRHGILQDIHMFSGEEARLSAYLPGRLAAAQLTEAFFADQPKQRKVLGEYYGLDRDLKALAPIKDWLKANVCAEGARLKPFDLIEKVTGAPLSPDAYMAHVVSKYAPPRMPVVATQLGFSL